VGTSRDNNTSRLGKELRMKNSEDVNQEIENDENKPSEDEVIFTTEQQAEVDRQISKAVENALARKADNNQAAIDKAVAEALAKAEKESKLSAAEKEKLRLTEREKALEEKEKEFERKNLVVEVKGKLTEMGLPIMLAEIIADKSDKDDVDQVLEDIKSDWDEKLQEAIKAGARQSTPRTSTTQSSGGGFDPVDFAREKRLIKD